MDKKIFPKMIEFPKYSEGVQNSSEKNYFEKF